MSIYALDAGPEIVSGVSLVTEPSPLRTERIHLSPGAELITFFEELPEHRELPLLAVLKDSLHDSDPDNDRLRQVWVFTYSRPSIPQRIAAGIPFLYNRAGLDRGSGTRAPRAVLDMGAPLKGAWARLAFGVAQNQVFDPVGAVARLTTRSYGGNLGEYRKTHLWEALDVLSSIPEDTGPEDTGMDGLTRRERQAIQARLELSGQLLGGLVRDEYLEQAYDKYLTRRTETRGSNWELLRQCAEENGLYFQPLRLAGHPASFALLWVAEPDLARPPATHFDRQFLNIANPFEDERLRDWTGYSEMWHFDDGSKATRMIPLALYTLDYPRAPFLLIDFRHPYRRKRSEMALRFSDDVTTGILGLTGFGNWGYMALKSSWFFVHTRHGRATDRSARVRAFVQLRHALRADPSIDSGLRGELLSRVERLGINPIERPWEQEVRDAWQQYDALMLYAQAPGGLARDIEADRGDEVRSLVHGVSARVFFRAASIGTLGLYRHRETLTAPLMVQLEQRRQAAWLRFRLSRGLEPLPPDINATVVAGQ